MINVRISYSHLNDIRTDNSIRVPSWYGRLPFCTELLRELALFITIRLQNKQNSRTEQNRCLRYEYNTYEYRIVAQSILYQVQYWYEHLQVDYVVCHLSRMFWLLGGYVTVRCDVPGTSSLPVPYGSCGRPNNGGGTEQQWIVVLVPDTVNEAIETTCLPAVRIEFQEKERLVRIASHRIVSMLLTDSVIIISCYIMGIVVHLLQHVRTYVLSICSRSVLLLLMFLE